MKKEKIRLGAHSILTLALLLSMTACDNTLEDRYDEFLDVAPSVCKDYCEIMSTCDRTGDGGEFRYEAIAARVHMCMTECAAYGAEGTYAWYRAPNDGIDRNMYKYISGNKIINAMSCLFDLGAFGCNNVGDSYEIVFNPVTRSTCEKADECIEKFDIDYNYVWTESDIVGGACQVQGDDFIDFSLF